MLTIIKCENCGSDSLSDPSVSVLITNHKFCDKCHHTHREERYISFCSIKCFEAFAAKITTREINLENYAKNHSDVVHS